MARNRSTLRQAVGVLAAPRSTFRDLAADPRWAGMLLLTFALSAMSSALLLSTESGQLALVDRWERAALAFGHEVDDAEYARLEALARYGPAYAVATRLVQGPVAAWGLAALIAVGFGRTDPRAGRYRRALAIVASAGVILALRDLIAAPFQYTGETLAGPATLSTLFPMFDEASAMARLLGLIDLFVLWWAVVLSIGISVVYGRRVRPVLVTLLGGYVVGAVVVVLVMALAGGTA